MRDWILRVLIAFDRFINTVFGGHPDETISARSAMAQRKGKKWGCILCKMLDKIEKDHCVSSIFKDGKDAAEVIEEEK